MSFSNQNLKKIPEVLTNNLDCDYNKLRYIPENLKLRYFGFRNNRIKKLPNLLFVDCISSHYNKIKDRSYYIYRRNHNKYYNHLCDLHVFMP